MSSTIPSIPALRPILAWQRPVGAPLPQLGELLRLRIALGPEGALLADDGRGLRLPLPPGQASVGDLLLLRVLATEPRLELQLVERRPASGWALAEPQEEVEPASMRAEQAWLARLQAGRYNSQPAALAVQWRNQVMSQLWRAAGSTAQAALPESLLSPGEPLPLAMPVAIMLPGWNAQALLLRLLSPQPPWQSVWQLSDEEAGAEPPADEEQGLRLSMTLDFNGAPLQLLLQWHKGLLLYFATEQAANLPLLRARLPRVATALAAVPLLLRHCQLALRPPLIAAATPDQQAQGLGQGSSGALFRAAAEIVSVLQQQGDGGTGSARAPL